MQFIKHLDGVLNTGFVAMESQIFSHKGLHPFAQGHDFIFAQGLLVALLDMTEKTIGDWVLHIKTATWI